MAISTTTSIEQEVASAVGRLPTAEIHTRLASVGAQVTALENSIRICRDKLDFIKSQLEQVAVLEAVDITAAEKKRDSLEAERTAITSEIARLQASLAAARGVGLEAMNAELATRENLTRRAAHGLLRKQFPEVLGTRDPVGIRELALSPEGKKAVLALARLLVGSSLAEGSPSAHVRQTTGVPTSHITAAASQLLADAWPSAIASATKLVESARVKGAAIPE